MLRQLPDTEGWISMTNQMKTAFTAKKALIPFITAGYPNLGVTQQLLVAAAHAGADMLEVSIPFSDPVAGGVTIQKADEIALRAGTTTDGVFDMLANVRKQIDTPLILMSYMNPIYVYGMERFFAHCADCGIDAVSVPDVPYEERELLVPYCKKYGIQLTEMIVSATKERIRTLAKAAQGFVNCVPIPSKRPEVITDLAEMIPLIKLEQDIPCVVGCDAGSAEELPPFLQEVDGIIVDTQLVQKIEQYGENCIEPCCEYIRTIKQALC